jgi:hypothetical protein
MMTARCSAPVIQSRPVTLLAFSLHTAAAGFADHLMDSPLGAEDIIGAIQAAILGGRLMFGGFAFGQSG